MPIAPDVIKEACPNPQIIIKKLDQHIIGQAEAKKTLAVMMLNRALLILNRTGYVSLPGKFEKTNALLIGPSGSGKTALIKALSEISDVTITTFDVSSLTASGYIGGNIEDILIRHVNNQDVGSCLELNPDDGVDRIWHLLERGVIYLDEIDKIRIRDSSRIDINGDMVQNELLKILEGSIVDLQSRKSDLKIKDRDSKINVTKLDTTDIFCICGGAFVGLEEIVLERLNKSSGVGFLSQLRHELKMEAGAYLKYVKTEDLIAYGFKPEFLGRIPLRGVLDPLTKADLVNIIGSVKNSLYSQYKAAFEIFGVNLVIRESGAEAIAEIAMDYKTGARALKAIMAELLKSAWCDVYNLEGDELVVDKAFVLRYTDGISLNCKVED